MKIFSEETIFSIKYKNNIIYSFEDILENIMFNCDLCNKFFKFRSFLESHKSRKNSCNKTKDSNECKLCNIEFPCLAKLKKHEISKRHINKYNIFIKEQKNIILSNELKLKNENNLLKKEISKYKNNVVEDNINIENNKLILKPLFNEITTSKLLNNIDLNLIISTYYQLLTIQNLLFIINYSINNLYIDKFWNSVEDDKWIYLDNELIEWFGYKEISKGKEKIVKFLKEFDQELINHKILSNNEFLKYDFNSPAAGELKISNNLKHIIINPNYFKKICMKIGTSQSEKIMDYFLELEMIFKFYNKYIIKYNQVKLEKTILIKNTYIDKTPIQCKEWLYLISNPAKARENIFKFGFTTNKQTRLSPYNTGSVQGDRFFYCELYECYNGRSLEKRVENLLKNFKIPNESEMYQLNFKAFNMLLKTICNNDNESVNSINTFLINDYDKYLNLDPVKFIFNIEEN